MPSAHETIRVATTPEDFEAFGVLVTAYVDWIKERYRDEAELVERVFTHQALTDELNLLPQAYAPPNGRALLAWADGVVCGCGAYRRMPDGACEMKRLFVPDGFRGRGIGRRLCAAVIESARADGFERMRLDTGDRLQEAIGLYGSFGFVEVPPYQVYPDALMPYFVFMELPLTPTAES